MVTLANPAVGRSVREASLSVLAPRCRTAAMSVMGVDALLFYRIERGEHARRRACSAARLDRMKALETLLGLPVDLPVPMDSLSLSERSAVASLPAGSADRDRRAVTRRAVRPLQVDLAVVRAVGWRRGLEQAGRFAPFCRRAVLLDRMPSSPDEALMEAAFYGIGVLAANEDGFELVLEPREYRPQRHTAAAWHFVEELYERIR